MGIPGAGQLHPERIDDQMDGPLKGRWECGRNALIRVVFLRARQTPSCAI